MTRSNTCTIGSRRRGNILDQLAAALACLGVALIVFGFIYKLVAHSPNDDTQGEAREIAQANWLVVKAYSDRVIIDNPKGTRHGPTRKHDWTLLLVEGDTIKFRLKERFRLGDNTGTVSNPNDPFSYLDAEITHKKHAS